ncbi:MAG: hypothetical protein PHI27_11570 [Eubacteriales bacterium]|nr:hypothetical protein [Eubacteriales bacterium]MDD3882868.1 hypothetical protein [Eubacteriales bacterium]MDD4512096.1 hypothetical protein [Eubacteriales bacterium]
MAQVQAGFQIAEFRVDSLEYSCAAREWPKSVENGFQLSANIAYNSEKSVFAGRINLVYTVKSRDENPLMQNPLSLKVSAHAVCTMQGADTPESKAEFTELLRKKGTLFLLSTLRSQIVNLSSVLGCQRPIIMPVIDADKFAWNERQTVLQ